MPQHALGVAPAGWLGDVDAPDALARDLLAQYLQLHALRDAAAAIVDGHALAGVRADERDDFAEVVHRLTVDRDDLIARHETGARRRPVGHHLSQHRRQRRRPELKAEPAEQLRRFGEAPALLGIGHAQFRVAQLAAAAAHAQGSFAARAHGVQQVEHHVALTRHRGAVDGEDFIPATQAGGGGYRARGHLADQGPDLGDTVHPQHAPQQQHREQDVEGGAGEQHHDALPGRTAREGARQLVRRHRTFALIEQLHVAAERQRGDPVFVPFGVDVLPQRLAEADGEAQHLEAEPSRDPEMAELMHRDQKAHGDHEPQRVPDHTHA